MKETYDLNNINNDIIITSENNEKEDLNNLFESKIIPNNIKDDFIKQNFLLIFVNPKSGPRQGLKILEHAEKYKIESISNYKIISFPLNGKESPINESNEIDDEKEPKENIYSEILPKVKKFSIILFNIMDEIDIIEGKKFVKKYLLNFTNNNIKILLAGGDGTISRCIEDLKKEEIPLSRCIFAPVPLGTGNDLSSSLGFGNECKVESIEDLQNTFYKYLTGNIGKVDIWEMSLRLDEEKGFIYSSDGINKNKINNFQKSFVNYFSMGFDAILGFIFEQKRTANRFCNKFIYGLEAFKRVLCCKKNYGMTELLENIKEGDQDVSKKTEEKNEFSDIEEVETDLIKAERDNDDNYQKIVFKTKNSEKTIPSDIILKGNPVTIICQNINYYMGGSYNIWERSSHLGVTKKDATKEEYEKIKKQKFDNFEKQSYDDKKLEILTYERGIEEGMEKIKKGMSNRIYQGTGPFFFEFKRGVDNNERMALENVYLNIDGEYYHFENPIQIIIKLNTNICDGQLNFIKNENS